MTATRQILVIDDSLTVRKLVELALGAAGYALFYAGNGKDGVATAARVRPDLILLDFVLPDMRGYQVCRHLAEQTAIAQTPILVMSGKDRSVLDEFAGHASVRGFIGKPFTSEQIVARVRELVAGPSGRAATMATPTPTPQPVRWLPEREQVARLIYDQLRPALAQIPVWAAQLGSASPAPYFAKRLITREVVDRLIETVSPFAATRMDRDARGPAWTIEGALGDVRPAEVLRTITSAARTGVLTFTHGGGRDLIALHNGTILLASCFEPDRWLAGSMIDQHVLAGPGGRNAETELRASGKPIAISLAEHGVIASSAVEPILSERTRALVSAALGRGEGRYSFTDGEVPAWASEWGRPVRLGQLVLEHRREVPPAERVDQLVTDPTVVLDRAPGFSAVVAALDLDADERMALTVLDGRLSVRGASERCGWALRRTANVLARLAEVGLIRAVPARSVTATPTPRTRSILVLDREGEGFARTLGDALGRRPEPIDVRIAPVESDWYGAVDRARPSLVLLEVAADLERSFALATAVAATNDLSNLRLIAVVDGQAAVDGDALLHAGFDAVLAKPIHVSEIERLLGRSQIRESA